MAKELSTYEVIRIVKFTTDENIRKWAVAVLRTRYEEVVVYASTDY
jgi:hypothetical protein